MIGRLRILVGAALAAALVVGFAPVAGAQPGTGRGAPYYLALGDSLAQGVQPDSSGQSVETNQGYVDDLYAIYRREIPGLHLAKLGCPGETTGSMIAGSKCTYPLGNQLTQAE